jgi:hypothetical protein
MQFYKPQSEIILAGDVSLLADTKCEEYTCDNPTTCYWYYTNHRIVVTSCDEHINSPGWQGNPRTVVYLKPKAIELRVEVAHGRTHKTRR